MPRHTDRTSPLAADHKKDSPQHIHLFELIERHRRFILGRTRGHNDHRPEGSLVGPIAVEDVGAFEPLAGSLVDPGLPRSTSSVTTTVTERPCSVLRAAPMRRKQVGSRPQLVARSASRG
jgi:hypothetical protein